MDRTIVPSPQEVKNATDTLQNLALSLRVPALPRERPAELPQLYLASAKPSLGESVGVVLDRLVQLVLIGVVAFFLVLMAGAKVASVKSVSIECNAQVRAAVGDELSKAKQLEEKPSGEPTISAKERSRSRQPGKPKAGEGQR